MTSSERRWVWGYAILLAILCSLPYIIGFSMVGDSWIFSGFVFGVEDGNSYIAKMLAGAQGAWLFTTPYTTMKQQGEIAFFPYILLGKMAAGPALHLQLVVLFHLFRILVTPLTIFAIYRLSGLFFESIRWRRWVTIMASVGGGLGWILPLMGKENWVGSLPLDFISPETFGFLAFLGLPHLILARGLMMLVFYRYLASDRDHSRAWGAGWLLLLLTLVQSLSTLTIYAVVVVHQGILWLQDRLSRSGNYWEKSFPVAVRSLLPSMPLILYYVLRFSRDSFLRGWTEQNRILSPHPVHYGLAYGALIPLILATLAYKPWREKSIWTLPLAWMIALPFLAYFPHNLQRRLVEGVWVALLLLGAYTLSRWLRSSRRNNLIWVLVTSIAFVSPFMLLTGAFQVASQPGRPAFIPVDQAVAFKWLQDNVEPGSTVLAAYETSNALPAWAPVIVPIGHGPESINGEELKQQVKAVYGSTVSTDERLAWLTDQEVSYLYYGPIEQALGDWNPQEDEYILEVYRSQTVSIFEVLHADD